jgi:NRAMP (natural resistance-associated macrophage protein)-like metal ion transporter
VTRPQPNDFDSRDDDEAPTIPHAEPIAGRRAEIDRRSHPVKRWLRLLGPGLITGASDDDPSGIGTYSIAGASFGFATLWTAIVTLPLMAVVQFLCAKIALVSGRGLAGVLRHHHRPRWVYSTVLCLVVVNTINAGTDIGAISAAVNLIVPVPTNLVIAAIALAVVALQIFGSYRRIATIFKWLTLSLFAYIGAAFLAKPDWGQVIAATFLPELRLDHEYLLTLVAILGTTISPYLFFWEASQEVEEEISRGRRTVQQRKGATKRELDDAKWDTVVGMSFSNLVFYFVILANAATLHASGKTEIRSATEAAQALGPLAGNAATVLFALGIIGAGMLAVPVLTGSAAYAIAEAFGWKYGLDTKPSEARQFYAIIASSTFIGMLVNFVGINPLDALFWTAVVNGVLAPPLLVVIMLVSNDEKIMGAHVNGHFTNVVGWITAAVMFAASFGMIATWR